MKKIMTLFVLSIVLTSFVACVSTKVVKEPDALGTYAFRMLKDLQGMSEQDFINKLLTIETLREAVKKEGNEMNEKVKNEISRMSKEDYNARIIRDYKEIKEKGTEYNIVWNKIKYIDYTYKARVKNGVKESDGTLSFSHNSDTYTVSISAMNLGDGYAIIELERLRKKSDDNNH